MSCNADNILDALFERLAAIEHARWAHWQAYMHEKATRTASGGLLLSPDLVERWQRQIDTPYEELSDDEKESDREQVRSYLNIIKAALANERKGQA
jgi:hypothetical protein